MAKKKAGAQVPAVIEQVPDLVEVTFATDIGKSVITWLNGAVAFFTEAKGLQLKAQATLVRFEQLKMPTTFEEDEQLKDQVRIAKEDLKIAESHWSITTALHNLHKWSTTQRSKTTDPLEKAIKLGTKLHNDHVEADRQRQVAEQNRLRQEAEAAAKLEREAAEKALEEAALAAEASAPDLSERETRFLDLYFANGRNAVNAAKVAGYKNHETAGPQLVLREKIQQAIKAREDAAKARQQAAAVKAQPVSVATPQVERKADTKGDTTTWGGECYDLEALLRAFKAGDERVRPLLMADPVAVNQLGKSMKELLDTIPGLRHTKKTGIR